MAPRTTRALAACCVALLGACGVTLTAPEESTAPEIDGGRAESGVDGPEAVDGGNDDASSDARPDARDGGCDAETSEGCACGTLCASKVCSDGGCDPLVFVSTETFAGDFGTNEVTALGFADAQCDSMAAAIPRTPSTTFMAWLGTPTKKVETRFTYRTPRPYRLADNVHSIVAMSFDGFNFDLLHAIDVTANGTALLTAFEVWTGSDRGGAASGLDCAGWTSATAVAPPTGSYGLTSAKTVLWTRAGDSGSCALRRRLYCFEQVQ